MLGPCQVALGSPRPLGGATPRGQGFFLPWLYRKQMEVFAQACNSPNKQTLVNWGVEQGLGLPAVPPAQARMAGWVREEPCSSFPIPSSAAQEVLHCPALLARRPPLPCASGVTSVQPPPKSSTAVPQIRCFFAHYSCADVGAALAQPHTIYIPGKASFIHPRPSPAHQGRTQARLVPAGFGAAWKVSMAGGGMG